MSYHLLWSGVGGQLLFYHICHQNQISYSKTNVSREASSKFHRTKLPKQAFRARLPRNFTEQSSKTSVSCEASSKFHRTKLPKRTFCARLPPNFIEQSFQNEGFLRGFLEISQNKLPKQAFRARLPRNFSDQASKTSVSCEASSKFQRTSFQNERFVRGFLKIS